jgi:tripartite-type tricarboxylate transporter receptor subunit TctC
MNSDSIPRRRILATSLAIAATAASGWSRGSAAQPYPAKAIRLLVGGAAGSVPDTVARVVGERLSVGIGKPVVVEDRPGAGGIIAMETLIASEPDGHTIALATMSQAVFNPYLFARLPYDPLRDLEPIGELVTGAMVVAAHPGFPARSIAEFVSLAKSSRELLFVGTAGYGSPPHIIALLLLRAAGVEVTIIPHKSGLDGLSAAMRGDVQLFIDAPTIIAPQVKSGRLRALAVTGRSREAAMPGVPTVAEAGLPMAEGEAWIGLVAPAGTPSAIVGRLGDEAVAALSDAEVRRRLESLSFVATPSTPEAFRATIHADHARWSSIIREAGLRLD